MDDRQPSWVAVVGHSDDFHFDIARVGADLMELVTDQGRLPSVGHGFKDVPVAHFVSSARTHHADEHLSTVSDTDEDSKGCEAARAG